MNLRTDKLSFYEALKLLSQHYQENGWWVEDLVPALNSMIEDLESQGDAKR